ncbi:multidrug ABC transporter [Neokomagataea thailandica NBRC 106555]|uniref:HlyD family secretion protein n=2 Tax=Neokomagataea TaxID=1223423 RepID=A0A4Y6V6G4_9PROT|nr:MULTISPECIES: HlyD family secretion protein [Neokomagataea]QDH24438.1 HlyD family secretion protein [Neokomagataea tanensis]GBR50813.1 multidrug ABC transporter [Neokomagataea thailandica NBRC 106555]
MAQDDQPSGSTPKKSHPVRRAILILIVLLIVVGIGIYVFLTRNQYSTDDAYTEGRKISVAAHVNGYVTRLLVNDNQFVHEGDVLFTVDNRDYEAALKKAQAAVEQANANIDAYRLQVAVAQKNFPGKLVTAKGSLAAAQAQLVKAEADYRRQRSVARAATSQQDIDTARAALEEARAKVLQAEGQLTQAEPVDANLSNASARVTQEQASLESARAQLRQAELNMEWTQVRAPHDGWIAERSIEQGNFVQTGQKLFTIVQPEVWVVANFKETQITRMRNGQKVDMSVDAYPDLKLHGHIDSIQLGSGENFSTFPPENATGNFVKTVQRIPVKIIIDNGLNPQMPLALGLSVTPTVYVK